VRPAPSDDFGAGASVFRFVAAGGALCKGACSGERTLPFCFEGVEPVVSTELLPWEAVLREPVWAAPRLLVCGAEASLPLATDGATLFAGAATAGCS
jgi:hypothetical protein